MQKPTFFLSSTIYDFSDLRGALRFFLQRQGCRVLASEYNDFTKPLDKNSYQACLSTIEQADYFILLIGSRVSDELDKQLADLSRPVRLRPDQWRSGDQIWIVEAIGAPPVIAPALKQLQQTAWKDKQVKMRTRGDDGKPAVKLLGS